MTNQEIADLFTEKVPEGKPKDLYDRFLDLAIYISDTLKENVDNTSVVSSLAYSLEVAYIQERI